MKFIAINNVESLEMTLIYKPINAERYGNI